MIPSATLQPYNIELPPSEDLEEARRFKEAMNEPLEVLKAFKQGKELYLTKDHLFEVAIACAQQNGGETAENIRKFGLIDQTHLFKVAKLCAQQSTWKTIEYLQNFHLTEDHRFEIAMICAERGMWTTTENIQKFGLTDQNHLFEVAKLCAQKSGLATAERIQKFGLTDRTHRFEVAKLCARQDGRSTAEHFPNFCLFSWPDEIDQQQHFEIAMACAQKDGGGIAKYLQNFSLTDQKQFYEIAMACAQQDGEETAYYIQNFRLTDQNQRFEIAMACARQNELATAKYLRNFGLTNQKQLFEVVIACVQKNPWALEFIPDGGAPFKAIVCDLKRSESPSKIIDRLFAIPTPWLDTSRLASLLQNIEEPEQQREAVALTAAALFIYSKTLPPEQLEWVSGNKFLDEIFALRAPYLRTKLVRLVTETSESFDQVPDTLPPLLRLPLAKLLAQGVDLSSLNLNGRALRDSAVLIPFLETMIELEGNETLLPEQKTAVIEAMSQKPFDLARDLLIILNFRRSDLLQTSLQRGLPTLAEEAFCSVLPLPQQVKDFSSRYEHTFGSYRQKNALKTYAANLNKDQENHLALPALGAHVVSVLEGTYTGDRYKPENNPHLQFLENHHPAILQAWQKNSKPQPLQDVLKSDQPTSASPSMRDWLREKLIADRHLDLNDYPFLEQLLEDDPEPARNSLIEQRKKNSKLPSIALQLKCYALSKSATEENTLRLLREIELLVPPSEFQNDIKAKIASLTENQAPADLTIVETDDPEDLLVCGTEIRGSCQRVDGDPSLNRGLVGYLLNGQTRMIAVKDKTGRLVARCLLRLLVDKEQKPVLFLERFYSNLSDPRLHTAIIAKAKQTADRLLCPLTSLEGETDYGSPLQSLGGPAPWEYVDGASGIQKSEYTINNPKLLYNPGKE